MIKKITSFVKWQLLIVALLAPVLLYGQSCQIVAKADACVGDIVSFSVTTASTPISYQWKLGAGITSTQPKPSYSYTAHGTFLVEVILKYPNGTSCTTTHSLTIHPKPINNFTIDNGSSNACFSKNKTCINDVSTPGPTGNPIAKRVFLWDDGAGDNTNNPAGQKTLCHTYLQTGTYSLLMEITDDKGCIAKSTKTVTILPDYDVSFNSNVFVSIATCKYRICLENTSTPKGDNDVVSYEWNFGDGNKVTNSSSFDTVCYDYPNDGNYFPYLKITHKSGCVDSAVTAVNVKNPEIKFNIEIPDNVCLGDAVTFFNNAINPGAEHRWFIRDSATNLEKIVGSPANPINYGTGGPGKFYIKLNILRDSCTKNGFDTLIVKGPAADFTALNNKQCTPGDTTYFCDASNYYRAYNVKRLWDLGHGAQCTTDTKKGLNVNSNCRFSVDVNPKHLYTHTGVNNKYSCFSAKLHLEDTVTKCESDAVQSVLLGMPPLDDLKITDIAKKYCVDLGGGDDDRIVSFKIEGLSCDQQWDMMLNFDSAFDSKAFKKVNPSPPPIHVYYGTSDPDGNVTIGFLVKNGNKDVYGGCNNLLPIVGQECADTVWYHHKINMEGVANPYTSVFSYKGCAPYNFTFRVDDTVQQHVKKIVWDWGDGDRDSVEYATLDSIIPVKYHTYLKNGIYTPFITLYNSRGCGETQYLSVALGFQNFVDFDSLVCAGDSIVLKEYISYYDKADTLWLDSARHFNNKEQHWWDFDDGNGFVYKKPSTKVVFPTDRVYKIRMASRDSNDCRDTFTFFIRAVKADAHIKNMADTFYCNDNIIRFYDSSFGSPQIPGDIATGWRWGFGDGKNGSSLKDPFHFYSSFGKKRVSLIVKSKAGCTDTAFKDIVIVGPVPYFEITTDSIGCDPHRVVFKNTSERVRTWIWNMGDPNNTTITTDNDTDIVFTYTPAGTYNVTLYGADSIYNPSTGNTYFCETTYPDTPLVKQIIVIPNHAVGYDLPDTVCQNNPFIVKSISSARYDWFRWWMGNGDSIFTDTFQFSYTYQSTGNYRIDFKPTYTPTDKERLCIADTFKDIVVVPILADFDINASSRAPVYSFTNKSSNAVRYLWDFGQPSSGKNNHSTEVNAGHNYKLEKGSFWVCLYAFNKLGCVDTICKPVENDYVPRLFIPNVFTPNAIDTLNNRFDIDIIYPLYYQLSIYNRWGEKVFESEQDGEGNADVFNWNGNHYKTNSPCPEGVYFVVFDYEILGTDERKQYNGTLSLFRNGN